MAGQIAPGRKVSSKVLLGAQVIDTIDFNFDPLWKDKHFLHQKYVLEGRSIAQIAAEIISSRVAIRNALIEFGIKRRQRGEPGKRPAQVPYGYRISNGLMVEHEGEQRILSAVLKMSARGLTLRQICEFLSKIGVPTKRRGQRWHPEMVRRISARSNKVTIC